MSFRHSGHAAMSSCSKVMNPSRLQKTEACRGFTTEMAWAVSQIKGEAAAEEGRFPDEPAPCWGPESVVCGQLQALR